MICALKQTEISQKNEFILETLIFLGSEFQIISVCFEWSISEFFVMKQPVLGNTLKKKYFGGSLSSFSNVYVTIPIEKSFSTNIA